MPCLIMNYSTIGYICNLQEMQAIKLRVAGFIAIVFSTFTKVKHRLDCNLPDWPVQPP